MDVSAPVSLPAPVEPAPDRLATAAMRALTREHPLPPRWGAAKTVVLGAITFGVLPIYAWPKTFRTAATIERQQLWHLAEWLRLCSGHPGADQLPELAGRAGFKPVLWTLSMFCVAVTAAAFAFQASRVGFDFDDLLASTFRVGQLSPPHLSGDGAQQLFIIWTVGLCLAYTLHWFHLHLHHANVRRFVEAFNDLTDREGIRPVAVPPLGLGIRPLWLVGAVLLAGFGAIWGIPMCLAGALHARWRRDGRNVRFGLADSLRQMLMLRRPALRVRRPVQLGEFCTNDLCRNRVPPQAYFCPRCGKHVTADCSTSSPPMAEVGKVA